MSGWQCLKRLWLESHRPELMPPREEVELAVLEQGIEVGKLARGLYPQGEEMPASLEKALVRTRTSGAPALFEACALSEGVLCRPDILVRQGKRWDLIEVKSSTGVKKEHIPDIAVQRYVLEGAGFQVRNCSVLHLDSSYVKGKDLDIRRLFAMRDVSHEVEEFLPQVRPLVKEQLDVLSDWNMPAIPIGERCHSPYDCPFIGFCWKHMPANSIRTVPRLSWDRFDSLYGEGLLSARDISALAGLTPAQERYVKAVRAGKPLVEKKEIVSYLSSLAYPLSFFDMETFAPGVPRYPGTRPYEALPFQYSLHVQQKKETNLDRKDFLHNADTEPSCAFAEALLRDMPSTGSVVVYHRSFEESRLIELERRCPKLAPGLKKVRSRLWDLERAFERGWYLDPRFQGSASLKAVLPVLAPGMSYAGHALGGGREAQLAYLKLLEGDSSQRAHLLDYCRMDSFGMSRVLDALRKAVLPARAQTRSRRPRSP